MKVKHGEWNKGCTGTISERSEKKCEVDGAGEGKGG